MSWYIAEKWYKNEPLEPLFNTNIGINPSIGLVLLLYYIAEFSTSMVLVLYCMQKASIAHHWYLQGVLKKQGFRISIYFHIFCIISPFISSKMTYLMTYMLTSLECAIIQASTGHWTIKIEQMAAIFNLIKGWRTLII